MKRVLMWMAVAVCLLDRSAPASADTETHALVRDTCYSIQAMMLCDGLSMRNGTPELVEKAVGGPFRGINDPYVETCREGYDAAFAAHIMKDAIRIMLTSHQIRAGRALVRWSARELAEKADISLPTVQRMEAASGVPSVLSDTMIAVQRALEGAGVRFTETGVPLQSRRSRLAVPHERRPAQGRRPVSAPTAPGQR